MTLIVVHRLPTVEEYNHLRKLAGWPVIETAQATLGLSRSLFGACVLDDRSTSIAGMGRIVGDNAIYLHIQDVVVHPEYQRMGIGKMIMKELMAYIDTVGGANTNIGLMCSKGREDFYKTFGFIERPNEKFGAGMIKIKD
jgi:ribosomal protein S18 acetylase RimI-like enzyme